MTIDPQSEGRARFVRHAVREIAVTALQETLERAVRLGDEEEIPHIVEAIEHAVQFATTDAVPSWASPGPEGYRFSKPSHYIGQPFSSCDPKQCATCLFKQICEYYESEQLTRALDAVIRGTKPYMYRQGDAASPPSSDLYLTHDFHRVFDTFEALTNGNYVEKKKPNRNEIDGVNYGC